MTSPDLNLPDKASTALTIYELQNVTKESAALAANQEVIDMVDALFDSIIDNLFGGFGDVIQAIAAGIADFIQDLVQALTGSPGDFNDIPAAIIQLPLRILGIFLGGGNPSELDSETRDALGPVVGALADIAFLFTWLQDLIDAICSAFRKVPVAGGSIATAFEDMANVRALSDDTADKAEGTRLGITRGWVAGSTADVDLGVYAVFMDIQAAIAAGYTVQTITSSQTWTKPASATHEIVVIAIGSGGTGEGGGTASASHTPQGGLGGGYLGQSFSAASVPATVPITVGTNGAQSSFGSLLVTTAGAGGISTPFGFSDTTSIPGRGGNGGHFYGSDPQTFVAPTAGQSTPLATGGRAEYYAGAASQDGRHGEKGGNVDTNVTTRCGGGGGGGGDYGTPAGPVRYAGGNGGAGGYPGAGGGAGGMRSGSVGTGTHGTGAAGGNGIVFIFYK